MIGISLGLWACALAGNGIPPGYSMTTYNGIPVTFNGAAVFDDGRNFYYVRIS